MFEIMQSFWKKIFQRDCRPIVDKVVSDKLQGMSISGEQKDHERARGKLTATGNSGAAGALPACDPLQPRVQDVSNTVSTSPLTAEDVQDLIREESLRQERANNIIISGLPEEDSENVTERVTALHSDLAAQDVLEAVRVGKSGTGRPRLIKVRLTPSGKRTLLKHKTSLRVNDRPNIYQSRPHEDRTAAQKVRRAFVQTLACKGDRVYPSSR